ncbi:amidohydrolase family protein [Sodalis ligni]|jgi:L-fuconolactonase|uniref:amidohydrolase family protein n=1 Tax=Sodalis ligni TaxID=2697027 RepID=UPI00193F9411|nr:amidohydrolase family protein [Sodalis ligni]QWA13383.1 amidohydrolase family protein [Sodalis ligni]
MPGFPLIDAHVHFYDQRQLDYPWLNDVPQIQGRYMPDDYSLACGGVEVEKMIFIEVDVAQHQKLDEVRFVEQLRGEDPRIAAIVACAALEKGAAVEEELERLAEIGAVRGIRRLLQYHEEPDYCLRPNFIEGVQRLAKFDFSFDICIRHHQLASATELVRRCPNVRFVLDHIAKPDIAAGLYTPWDKQIAAIAELPNVVCKITGVTTEADRRNWTLAQIRPYIEHVIEQFGFSRILFASDWPVLNLGADYPRWVAVMDEILTGCSDQERRRFYRENAASAYKLS